MRVELIADGNWPGRMVRRWISLAMVVASRAPAGETAGETRQSLASVSW